MTRCTSADEFIARFARFTTEHDVVVPALPQVKVGDTGPFAIYLKDLTVMMKGRCEVTEIRPVSTGADGEKTGSVRALMRLHMREMDAHSCGIHLRLMERHAATAAAKPAPPPAPPEAVPVDAPAAADATADVSTGMVVAEERSQTDTETTTVSPTPTEKRVPGAALMLPANPLGDLDAADLASFVELGLDQENHHPPLRTRLARIPRKTRRLAAYASCAIVGLVLGIVISPGSKAAPVVRVATVVPTPAPVAPAPPPPPPEPAAAPEAPDDPLPTATRKHSHRTVVVERVKRTRTVKTVRTRTQRHSRVVQRSH